jgi:hypothetical protein
VSKTLLAPRERKQESAGEIAVPARKAVRHQQDLHLLTRPRASYAL